MFVLIIVLEHFCAGQRGQVSVHRVPRVYARAPQQRDNGRIANVIQMKDNERSLLRRDRDDAAVAVSSFYLDCRRIQLQLPLVYL